MRIEKQSSDRWIRGSRHRLGLLILVVVALAALPSHATDYTITTFVDDDVDNGNCTLREAMDAALRNVPRDACAAGTATDVITLQAGSYNFAGGEYFSNATGEDVKIIGQGPELTTVSMGFQNRFLRYRKNPGPASTLTLERFSLAAGRKVGTLGSPTHGGAVHTHAVNLTLKNMKFALNQTMIAGHGGAVYFGNDGSGEDVRFELADSEFDTNTAAQSGGAIAIDGDDMALDLRRTLIQNNIAGTTGGGLHVVSVHGQGFFVQLDVIGNRSALSGGGGMLTLDTGFSGIYGVLKCVFRDNQTEGAGAVDSIWASGLHLQVLDTVIVLTSTSFEGNRTTSTASGVESEQLGIGILDPLSSVLVRNPLIINSPDTAFHVVDSVLGSQRSTVFNLSHATVAGNGHAGKYDDLHVQASTGGAVLENSIFFDNEDTIPLLSGIHFTTHGNLEIIDPLFVDQANGDYRLAEGSPAIDVSTQQILPNVMDFEDDPRPQGVRFDAGAFEAMPADSIVFADGFESGDVLAWAAHFP